jgi:hypothetical protein
MTTISEQHFNIQVNIQKVIKPTASASRTGLTSPPAAEREVIDVLKLAVTAETEAEAYRKVELLLEAYRPVEVVPVEVYANPRRAVRDQPQA